MRVGVIDYGVGNIGSVMRALEELNVTPVLLSQIGDMRAVDKLILPGVGSFTDCANLLNKGGWMEAISEEVQVTGKSLLGICLGMQLLATTSIEGADGNIVNSTLGLNLIPGHVENLRTLGCNFRIPHVGWNDVKRCNESAGLFDGIQDNTDFYFVHSYVFVPNNPNHIIANTIYDITIAAAVRYRNVWGTQFHPEKSSRAGLQLLYNFVNNSIC